MIVIEMYTYDSMYSQYNCAPKVLELRHILAYPAVGFDDEKEL
jgi:hypothetical protein